MPIFKDITEVIAWLMVLFTGLPLIRTHYWWVRILDFPRMQIVVVMVCMLGTYPNVHEMDHWLEFVLLGLLVVALGIQFWYIYPFTMLAPIQALKYKPSPQHEGADSGNTIRIMLSNIRMDNHKTDRFLQIVKQADPDLILVNEPNHWWADQLSVLDKTHPYSVKQPQENTYGMMFFSRLELVKKEKRFLVEDHLPSIYTQIKLCSGEIIEFYGVHPEPPAFLKHTDEREAELLMVGKMAKKSSLASIVAGDLNDVGWSHTTNLFQRISGLLDPRKGRGFYNTYSVFVPLFRYPLDHIFYDPRFRLARLERLPKFGSDHFPILIELVYHPAGERQQEHLHADQEDKQEAAELITKGLEED